MAISLTWTFGMVISPFLSNFSWQVAHTLALRARRLCVVEGTSLAFYHMLKTLHWSQCPGINSFTGENGSECLELLFVKLILPKEYSFSSLFVTHIVTIRRRTYGNIIVDKSKTYWSSSLYFMAYHRFKEDRTYELTLCTGTNHCEW